VPRVDGRQHCPATLPGIGHPACELIELRGAGQGVRCEIEEPGSHDRAATPYFGHFGEVEVVLVGPRIAYRRGLCVDLLTLPTGVGVGQDVETFSICSHDPVLDPVMDHLDKMARSM
jgi:hypothetical protein